MTMLTQTTGTAFIMWLGEQITDRGIGNGMSLIIFAGIVVGLPRGILDVYEKISTNEWSVLTLIVLVALMIAVVAFIVLVERGQRRITVQYAKRVVGRRVLGGQSTHLPLRVNTGGVIFFCYFYTSIIFNPNEVADNMRKYGGFIPGIRPGKRTAEYVNSILTRITLVGALYLALIAIIPEFMMVGFHVQSIPLIGQRLDAILPQFVTQGLRVNFYFGGTSLLIVVGVAMDTIQMVESQLIMRHYDGFLKKSRIRGRRG